MGTSPERSLPLAGLTVLDFSRVLAGPWVGMNLADLGADVIKIENPRGGDDTRHYGRLPARGGESPYFHSVNRNKRSLALDITRPEGQAVVKRLAATADVVIENFRADVMGRHGLDHAALCAINPRLVYCSISGYGHGTPQALVAGYDPVAQAESGMMWMTGEADGPPLRTGVSYVDIFTGMYAVQGIMAALMVRERTGEGQHVDLSLLDCAATVVANYAQAALMTGESPMRIGNGHSFLWPFGPIAASDGLLSVIIGNEGQWRRFCERVIERPDLLTDPRFATNAARLENKQAVSDLLAGILAGDTREAWMKRFHAAGVPAGAIRDVMEALDGPEIAARGLRHTVQHPRAGSVDVLGSPIRFSSSRVADPVAAPLLGAGGREALMAGGFRADEVDALEAAGVLGRPGEGA